MKPTHDHRHDAVVSDKTGVELRPRDNKQDLATAAAREFINTVAELQRTGDTVTGDGIVRVVLTGGGAGIATLAEIAALDHAAKQSAEDFPVTTIDWSQVYVFFGDDRFLPAGDPERNDKQAFDALLRHVDIPSLNVFRIPALAAGEHPDGPALDARRRSSMPRQSTRLPRMVSISTFWAWGRRGTSTRCSPTRKSCCMPRVLSWPCANARSPRQSASA